MNGPEPVRPPGNLQGDHAGMVVPLLREWARLRERETELLRQIADLLEQSSHGRAVAEEPREAAAETAVLPGDVPSDFPVPAPDDPTWIDRTIEAVLAGAFSADDEPEAAEVPAVDLLLLRSGDTWVGMPWDRVARLGLSDEAQPLPGTPLSLREILGQAGEGGGVDQAAEPYRLTWDTAGGPRSLCCEVLGGVLASSAAAARHVELIWLPDDSAVGGRLLPLVEFFAASGRNANPEFEVPGRGADHRVPSGDSASTRVDSVLAESPPAPAPRSPLPVAPRDPDPDLPPGPPAGSVPAGEVRHPAPDALPVEGTLLHQARDTASREPASTRRAEASAGGPSGGTPHPHRPVMGLRSALVSVRYLPARVAIARAFRSLGWFVLETADTAELPDMLRRVHHTVVFIEAPERPDPGWAREVARARGGGARIVGVSSRLRGAAGDPWHGLETVPHLLFPFQEAELERLIESLG